MRSNRKLVLVPRLLGQSALEQIGNTPLLRIECFLRQFPRIQMVAKAEWFNPGGSVKDRAAARIVAEAFRTGQLEPGRALLDASSGNAGIAYAMLGASHEFPVTLCVPSNVSVEHKRVLHAFGAEVIWTDAAEGLDGAVRQARELAAAEPSRYFYADQYSNDANWQAHFCGTANEIWQQTSGRVTHFVAMLGTSGTFVGTSRRLKELNRRIQCISLQPDSPFHGIAGAKHMASTLVPAIYDPSLADDNIEISTEEAYAMVKRLAREEGLLVGISAGAAMAGCLRVAEKLKDSEAVIVTVFPDAAGRYLSAGFWDER